MPEQKSIAILIVSRNRPDLVKRSVEHFEADSYQNKDILVIECGSEPENIQYPNSIYYADSDFKGKCFGQNFGLQYLNMQKQYDYYLFCMNDVFINDKTDFLQEMVDVMDANPTLAMLSPSEKGSNYPGSKPQDIGVRPVTTSDYLFLMIKGEVVKKFGFFNPHFKYCWGAIHEYSYKLYQSGYYAAYYDYLDYLHLGGTTYGNKNTKTISREDYLINAKAFAYRYFIDNYGPNWDEEFWRAATAKHQIEHNTYAMHRKYWQAG